VETEKLTLHDGHFTGNQPSDSAETTGSDIYPEPRTVSGSDASVNSITSINEVDTLQQEAASFRLDRAPNGEAWPSRAGYVTGYAQRHTGGLSKVSVDNGQNDSNVFVKLVSVSSPEADPVRHFFVPAGSTFTVEDILPGKYDVRYRDLVSGRLARTESFELKEIEKEGSTQFSNISLTLYKVRNGNMETYEISESEF